MHECQDRSRTTLSAGAAIQAANDAGRLGLIVYAIPGFPDPGTYDAVIDILARRPEVSVLETTFPVRDRFSEYANDTIRRAHRTGSKHSTGLAGIDHLRGFPKPVIHVLYRASFEDYGFEAIVDRSRDILAGLLFEWDIGATETYVDLARRRGMELIQCAGAWMSGQDIAAMLALTDAAPLIYLVSAAKTGGDLLAADELAGIVSAIKSTRPDARIAAGFGVASAGDVRALKQIDGLDAVIIGTAFLKTMGNGPDAVENYLDSLAPALKNS